MSALSVAFDVDVKLGAWVGSGGCEVRSSSFASFRIGYVGNGDVASGGVDCVSWASASATLASVLVVACLSSF